MMGIVETRSKFPTIAALSLSRTQVILIPCLFLLVLYFPSTMKQLLYIEIPTPDVENVCNWLQTEFQPGIGIIRATPDGIQVQVSLGKLS